jgi:hypothetical protein
VSEEYTAERGDRVVVEVTVCAFALDKDTVPIGDVRADVTLSFSAFAADPPPGVELTDELVRAAIAKVTAGVANMVADRLERAGLTLMGMIENPAVLEGGESVGDVVVGPFGVEPEGKA